jgi:import inner membrane translocase subunit TIM21
MLRSSSLGLARRVGSRRTATALVSAQSRFLLQRSVQPSVCASSSHYWRTLSSQSKQDPPKQEGGNADDAADETKEIVLTPGEAVVAASRLGMWAGILGFACVCAYYIGKELLPTKMSPNSVFNNASSAVRTHPQVQRQYGDKIKVYGRDHGGHREGRRNFIEHTEYTDPEDNSSRTRVRFNLEGQHASAFCFAEVSNQMPSGEFVYILVQDKESGRVITVVDNRSSLTAARLAGGSKESAGVMQQLLGGGGRSSS